MLQLCNQYQCPHAVAGHAARTHRAVCAVLLQVPISCLQWEHRLPLILQEVREADADIICLQELNHFGGFPSNSAAVMLYSREASRRNYIEPCSRGTQQHCWATDMHNPHAHNPAVAIGVLFSGQGSMLQG